METPDYSSWAGSWHGHFFRDFAGLQAKRGDMSPIVLKLLTEKPMHGYEIIRALEAKSHGMWRPSPGSIYPTLQMLEEQELISASSEGGKRVYTVTPEGRKIAESSKPRGPVGHDAEQFDFSRIMEIRGTFMNLAGSFRQIMRTGQTSAQEEAIQIIKEAGVKLEALLQAEQAPDHKIN